MLNSLNEKIRKSFSKTADQYDILASLHREIGRELIAKVVKHPQVDSVLDVGCGTGYLTGKAKFYFPGSRIVGLDFAEGMLKVASQKHEGIEWVLADAQTMPFQPKTFDLVVSNLAYQWVGDLNKAFAEVRRVLRPQGAFSATVFGYFTCDEMFQSFDLASNGALKFRRLASLEEIQKAIESAGFVDAHVDYERIKIQFNDLWDLMNWLKSIGANNLPAEGSITKGIIQKAAEVYRQRFPYHHGVCATFEIIWIYANG